MLRSALPGPRHALALLLLAGSVPACGPSDLAAPRFEFGAHDANVDFTFREAAASGADHAVPGSTGYGLALQAAAGTYTNDTNVNGAGSVAALPFVLVTLRTAAGGGPANDWILSFEQGGKVLGTARYAAMAPYVHAIADRRLTPTAANSIAWDVVAINSTNAAQVLAVTTRIATPSKVLSPPTGVSAALASSGTGATMSWNAPSTPVMTYEAELVPFMMPTAKAFVATVPASQTSASLSPTSGTYDEAVLGLDVDEAALSADTSQTPSLPPQVDASEGTGSATLMVP